MSAELNEVAVGDFLHLGCNQAHETTTFKDIQRLPPGHALTCHDGETAVARYWTLPIEDPVYYRRDSDYVDEFRSRLTQAVSDRLRTKTVSVFMSGGLDSPILAATAKECLRSSPTDKPVRAFTLSYARLFADPERAAANVVATHLDIPIQHYMLDERIGWCPEQCATLPEPALALLDPEPERRSYNDMAAHSRVAFYGEGPDNALRYEWTIHLKCLAKRGQYWRLGRDITKHVFAHKRVPLLPSFPKMLCLWATERRSQELARRSSFPEWRWNHQQAGRRVRHDLRQDVRHPWRPSGYASLLTAQWQTVFERLEPAITGTPVEFRHPFLDIRVLRYMLRVPALPWCRKKHLLRKAAEERLPMACLERAKVPLAGDPYRELQRLVGLPGEYSGPDGGRGEANGHACCDTPDDIYAIARQTALKHWTASTPARTCSQPTLRRSNEYQQQPAEH